MDDQFSPGREMTPQDVADIRQALGLSQAGLAVALRMGKGAARTVRSWEAGTVDRIPGPVQVALEALAAGWRPGMRTYGATEIAHRLRVIRMRTEELAVIAEELAKASGDS